MGRACTICRHAERAGIDAALVTHSASYRALCARYGVALASLARHADAHLPVRLLAAQDAADVAAGDTLLAELTALGESSAELLRVARTILARSLNANDLRAAIAAIHAANGVVREQRGHLELREKMRETDDVIRRLDELEQADDTKGAHRWRA